MKQTLISLVAALTLVLTACDKNDDAPGGCIEIIPTIGSQTRVPSLNEDGSGGFTKGDQFTIVTSRGWETARSSDYTVGGDWQTWEQLGYPTGVKINFAACYPPAQPAGDGTFTFDSSTAEYKDLLLAPAQPVDAFSTVPIYLAFGHALHKLELNFTADAADYTAEELAALTLTCTARKACVVDARAGTVRSVTADKAAFHSTGAKAVFILPPQPTADVEVELTVGESTTSMTLADLLEQLGKPHNTLDGGSRLELNITLSREEGVTDTPVNVGDATIGPWDDQDIVSGTVGLTPGDESSALLVSPKPSLAWGEPLAHAGQATVLQQPGDETPFGTQPDVYYEYSRLDDTQREVYRLIRDNSAAFDDGGSPLPRIQIAIPTGTTSADVTEAADAFNKDQASFFHFNRAYPPAGTSVSLSYKYPYSTFAYRYRLATEGADEILDRLPAGLDDYGKAKWLWDEFLKSVSYGQKEGSEGTVYGAFVLHKIVCEGYARGYQYLCQRAGIQALYYEGTAPNPQGGSELHAWNVLRIGGKYYLADPTWDDGMSAGSDAVFYKLFLRGSNHAQFAGRMLANGYTYPALSTTDYPHNL